MRKTFYDRTGRCPRSLREAFGPYADRQNDPEELLSPIAVFACVCVLCSITAILLLFGLI